MYNRKKYNTILHNPVCHESSLTVCIDLFFYQCSVVLLMVRGMPNTTFRIFVICSGYMQFILSTSIVSIDRCDMKTMLPTYHGKRFFTKVSALTII